MNRFVKPKAPAFLKVFERNDEKDDRRLLEMSTNSFGSLPATTDKQPGGGGSEEADRSGGSHEQKCEANSCPGEDAAGDQQSDAGPLPKTNQPGPEGTESTVSNPSPVPETKELPTRASSSAKGTNREGEGTGANSRSSTPAVGENRYYVRSQSDRRLARNDGLTRSHSERSMGSEPSAYNAPPKPSFGPEGPYPASPPHRLSEVPVSIVKHAEACFSSPEKARKPSLFGRLRPRREEAPTQHEQVEVAVAEVDGGRDSIPFAQLTLEASGSNQDKIIQLAVGEDLDKESDHNEMKKSGAESTRNLKHSNRESSRVHEGRRQSSRQLLRKKSGERLSQRNRMPDSGQSSSRGLNEDQIRRKSRTDEANRAHRRRRSESMPRRRSVSRTRSGKPDAKVTKVEATVRTSKPERSPSSPNRSSSPTRRKASQVGETLEWRRNPRSCSKGPVLPSLSPNHRSKLDRRDCNKQDRVSRREVTTNNLIEESCDADRTEKHAEQARCPSQKHSAHSSQSFSDESSTSLRHESSHSMRGILGTFLDQKRTFSEHILPTRLSDGSQNQDDSDKEFAGDGQGVGRAKDADRGRNASADTAARPDSPRKKPLLQFPLDSEHTMFSFTDPNATTNSLRKTEVGGRSEVDAARESAGKNASGTNGVFESNILQQAPEASESGGSEPELPKTACRKHHARRSSRRRSSTTALDSTQPPTPKRVPRRATTSGAAPASTGRARKVLALPRSEQKHVVTSIPSLTAADGDTCPESPRRALAKTPSAILEVRNDSDCSDSTESDDNMTSPSADMSRDVPAPVSFTFSEIPFLTISKDIVENAERSSSQLRFTNVEASECGLDGIHAKRR